MSVYDNISLSMCISDPSKHKTFVQHVYNIVQMKMFCAYWDQPKMDSRKGEM